MESNADDGFYTLFLLSFDMEKSLPGKHLRRVCIRDNFFNLTESSSDGESRSVNGFIRGWSIIWIRNGLAVLNEFPKELIVDMVEMIKLKRREMNSKGDGHVACIVSFAAGNEASVTPTLANM